MTLSSSSSRRLDAFRLHLILNLCSSLFFTLVFTANLIYHNTIVKLSPLQLAAGVTALGLAGFALARGFGLALALYLVVDAMHSITSPLYDAWLNQRIAIRRCAPRSFPSAARWTPSVRWAAARWWGPSATVGARCAGRLGVALGVRVAAVSGGDSLRQPYGAGGRALYVIESSRRAPPARFGRRRR